MVDTLFSPSFGNKPQIFVGRSETMQTLIQGLRSMPGSRDRAVLLLGQRGYGKTVLMLELADAARREGFVVASPTVVSPEMPHRILEKLIMDGEPFLRKEKRQISGGSVGALGFSAGVSFQQDQPTKKSFAQRLSELCQELNSRGKGVLILVDELVANQPELKQLIIAYQEMVGEGRNIAIIMAGLPAAVAAALNDHVLTFLNRAKKETLTPLRIQEIDLYYRDAFSRLGVQIAPADRMMAAKGTEGSPYLMQLIGHYITLCAQPGCALNTEEMEEAIRRAGADFENDICQTSLSALSEKDIAFLSAMAQAPQEKVALGLIQKTMGVSPAYSQTYKRRLMQAGVIESPGRGLVQFAIPYLREYLRKTSNS